MTKVQDAPARTSSPPGGACVGCGRELPPATAQEITEQVLAIQRWQDDGGRSDPGCPCEAWEQRLRSAADSGHSASPLVATAGSVIELLPAITSVQLASRA
jgi:hypothetical protein